MYVGLVTCLVLTYRVNERCSTRMDTLCGSPSLSCKSLEVRKEDVGVTNPEGEGASIDGKTEDSGRRSKRTKTYHTRKNKKSKKSSSNTNTFSRYNCSSSPK